MIYRKAPRRPVRLLLKVAAVSTVAVAACGGVVEDQGLHGSIANCAPDDLACEGTDAGVGGGIRDAGNPCAQGCGLLPSTHDAGEEDAATPDDAGVLGLVVNMDGGEDDDAAVVIGVVPHK